MDTPKLNIVSLFSGAGGLDLGFKQAGFNVVFANEHDKTIWETYARNHTETPLSRIDVNRINMADIPPCVGIIGGPPCQSWSEAGAKKGIHDSRGKLFFQFIRIIEHKKPIFFLAENVSGMTATRHSAALYNIRRMFKDIGYTLHVKVLNASNYGAAQDRKRIIFIGFRDEWEIDYKYPDTVKPGKTLHDVIRDLEPTAVPARNRTKRNPTATVANHEYSTDSFSPIFMSRNRVRQWHEPSFTIQAGGRQAPLHPNAPPMRKVSKDVFEFMPGHDYRRLSVRECARIQGFPDDFIFHYDDLNQGYKMVGNAVNVDFARVLAESIKKALSRRGIRGLGIDPYQLSFKQP